MYSHMSAVPDEDLLEITSIIGRGSDEVKRAHRAADRLQLDLLNGAFTERFSLGTVREIRERYGLGRWACREAIGILELRGVARIRAGRGGGLVATAPSFGNLAKLMLLHLYMKRASTRELIEARRLVHLAALRRVVERGGEPEELVEMRRLRAVPQPKLRDAPASLPSFSGWLADRTGNRAFRFAVDFVETLCGSYVIHAEAPAVEAATRGVQQEEEALWQAICRQDLDTARPALIAYLGATERVPLDKGIRVRRLLSDRRSVGATKSAHRVAMGLVEEIVEALPSEAADLGSELDIGLRHSANAEIVRQAIRLLEDLGVANPRRGRYGGLEPREPDAAPIIGLIPHILIQDRLKISDCFDAAGLLKVEMAMRAAGIGKAGWGPKAQAARDAVGRVSERLHSVVFERTILDLVDNSVLTACERGFLMYACNIKPVTETDPVPVATVERISSMTRRVVERILEGDVDGTEAAALEKHRSLALRFAPSPTGLPEDSARHPLSVVSAREQELLAAGLRR